MVLPMDLLKMFVLPYEVVKEQKLVFTNNFGPERARTADLLLAKQALYQLSYRPENAVSQIRHKTWRIALRQKWWAKEELHL